MNAARISLDNGINLTYSREHDARVTHATMSGAVALVTARSAKAAAELAREAEAWGFTTEREGRNLKVA